jgi:hypothetical protein
MRITNASRLIGATISAGLLAGVGAVGFHYLADYLDDVLFTWVDAQRAISRLPFVLIVPTVGLFLIGLFLLKCWNRCSTTRAGCRWCASST